jgi:acyl carrier protein
VRHDKGIWLPPTIRGTVETSGPLAIFCGWPGQQVGRTPMSIRDTIIDKIIQIADQQHKRLAPLTDNLALLESGLDSLCIAILVATLDDTLGLDPFAGDNEIDIPVTLGDFITLYENAAV